MRLSEAADPVFARHETFHPRYGWFRKAYAFAADDPYTFTRDDAPVIIGVGKNMVRSIRFWGLAAKLIVEDPKAPNRREPGMVPTRFGHALFGADGWDPYMEDPGTIWLLHWMLLAPRTRLPVWWLAFNELHFVEFDVSELEEAVLARLAVAEWDLPHLSSIHKDVGALVRTYAPLERSGRMVLDDVLDCPLRELQLIGRSAATGKLRFTLGRKASLPPSIVAFAVLDYVARIKNDANTITLGQLADHAGAPGKVFKLTELDLQECLAEVAAKRVGVSLASPAGVSQMSWKGDPGLLARDLLDEYYGSSQAEFRAGPAGEHPIDDDLLEELGLGRDIDDPIRKLRDLSRAAS